MTQIRERAGWLAAAVVLTAAFFVAPIALFGSGFAAAAAREFPPFILGGTGEPSGALADLATTWSQFHIVKAVCAAALVALALHRRHRALALVPAVLMIANIQGALAPMSSAMSMLDTTGRGASDAVVRAVAVLRSAPESVSTSAAVTHLVRDFAWYHGVLAALFAALVAVMLAYAVRAARQGRPWWAAATLVAAVIAGVVTAANVSITLHPAAGLALL